MVAVTTEPGRPGAAVGEEHRRRIEHLGHARLGHLEDAELVRGAVAVLQRVQHPQRVVTVALEREHGVDDVLERARARRASRPW